MNKYFQSVFSIDDNSKPYPAFSKISDYVCSNDANQIINGDKVLKKLTDLNGNKSSGPDLVNNLVLKKHIFLLLKNN